MGTSSESSHPCVSQWKMQVTIISKPTFFFVRVILKVSQEFMLW